MLIPSRSRTKKVICPFANLAENGLSQMFAADLNCGGRDANE
jgi:hypothetical protein